MTITILCMVCLFVVLICIDLAEKNRELKERVRDIESRMDNLVFELHEQIERAK